MFTRHIIKAIVLNEKGELLMLRRSNTDVRRPLQWDLPGGYRDPGEALESCMRREVKEESGLTVEREKLVYSTTEIREWIDEKTGNRKENVVFLFYLAQVAPGQVTISHEHSEYQWKQIEQAVSDYEYPLHKNVLQYILKNELLSLE